MHTMSRQMFMFVLYRLVTWMLSDAHQCSVGRFLLAEPKSTEKTMITMFLEPVFSGLILYINSIIMPATNKIIA